MTFRNKSYINQKEGGLIKKLDHAQRILEKISGEQIEKLS